MFVDYVCRIQHHLLLRGRNTGVIGMVSGTTRIHMLRVVDRHYGVVDSQVFVLLVGPAGLPQSVLLNSDGRIGLADRRLSYSLLGRLGMPSA